MSSSAAQFHSLLHQELRRAVALEEELHGLVSKQLRHDDIQRHPRAVDWLRRLEPRVHAHRVALAASLERLSASRGRAGLLSSALEELAEWTRDREAPGPELTRDLRQLYALLSATIACYVVVAITADVVGDEATTTLAQSHSDDANTFLEELAELITSLTREELERARPEPGAREGE